VPIDIEAAYARYGPMVLRRCKRLLGPHDAGAADAMQDVFVLLLRHRDSLQADHMASLLYTMATRVCLNLLRGRARRPESPQEALLQALAALSDTQSGPLWARLTCGPFGVASQPRPASWRFGTGSTA
jgi:RNA polymerase sigma-70 factor (ECF subfamily)